VRTELWLGNLLENGHLEDRKGEDNIEMGLTKINSLNGSSSESCPMVEPSASVTGQLVPDNRINNMCTVGYGESEPNDVTTHRLSLAITVTDPELVSC
jgi:hypothetical protein